MKGKSSFVQALQHLNMAAQCFEDFKRDSNSATSKHQIDKYLMKVNWVLNDIKTWRVLSDATRAALAKEIHADAFGVKAIMEKAALLPVDKRDEVEAMIDSILKEVSASINNQHKTIAA